MQSTVKQKTARYGELINTRDSAEWVAEAQSAIEASLPANHAIIKQWKAHEGSHDPALTGIERNFQRYEGFTKATLSILQNNRLGSILDGVRTETVGEVLDQADELLAKGHVVPGAILAGGALETHLHFLCDKYSISWQGSGSINKYDGVIAQARKTGKEVYSGSDSKQVTAWGGLRNDAAHRPTEFVGPKERVTLMSAGIRAFIARVA